MKIHLIRHGETDWNKLRKFQGRADVPLNAQGELQAKWVAERYLGSNIDAIYTSPLIRAYKTANEISKTTGIKMNIISALSEIDVGDWQGKTWEEAQNLPSSGESVDAFFARAASAINEVIESGKAEVVVVTHGGTLRMILTYLLGLSIEDREHFKPSNVGVYIVEKTGGSWKLLVNNDVSHVPPTESPLVGDDRNA